MLHKHVERKTDMKVYQVTSEQFKKYGRVLNLNTDALVEAMTKETPLPDGVDYQPSISSLESLEIAKQLQTEIYGELPIQVGYCNGHNVLLNALEYHRSSEINIGATDAILMVGCQQDVTEEFTYDTSKVEAFFLPKGTAVEVYATTLHYAPCNASEDGFKVCIVLPKGTNEELTDTHKKSVKEDGEDALITAKNKWLIGHAEGGLPEGSHIGLIGENLSCATYEL